jgi:choline dehydrogenase-like flavoprotein
MSQDPSSPKHSVDHSAIAKTEYDVVIVGSGISGAIMAKDLSAKGAKVLIVEAGPGKDMSLAGYEKYLNNFFSAVDKDNNAPFPINPNARMPRGNEVEPLQADGLSTKGYFVQKGPLVSDSSFSKVVGGTTMHFESKTPRMLPDDFTMQSQYGHGLDWPVSYEELMPYYRKAEFEMGVSGDVESQKKLGIEFEPGYVFPMHEMPPTYLDKMVAKDVDGTKVKLDGSDYEITIDTYPQGRNGIPNKAYKNLNNGKAFIPDEAVSLHQADMGGRCQGNTNCTPICPVQAKYDARKTLAKAVASGTVDILPQTVATRLHTDAETGRITEIDYKTYHDFKSPEHVSGSLKAKTFILAANAVENARLMLASGLHGSSNLVGKNLMDHPYILTWGLLPEPAGTMRGTICTSGISNLRNGSFRKNQAAFAVDIHNDGWGWATGSPSTNLHQIVDNLNKYGPELRGELVSQISRQLLMAFMVELPPQVDNKVTVDPAYTDQLGNMRPVISFGLPEYSLDGIAYARQFSRKIFQLLGAEDHTYYDPLDPSYITHKGEGFAIRGGNHLAGTHIMGTSAANSVVNDRQKSWDHSNLYLVGAGSMPTIGTSNTTLTLAALCFRTAEDIHLELSK